MSFNNSEFNFEKCKNAVIRLDSRILGAVSEAVCTSVNSFYDINEFLTDKPVSRILESRYTVELKMTVGADNPFVYKKYFDTLELLLTDKTVREKCAAAFADYLYSLPIGGQMFLSALGTKLYETGCLENYQYETTMSDETCGLAECFRPGEISIVVR